MTSQPPSYRGYRFPAEIISHAVWVYHRFGVSFRDVEDLLAERGVTVTYESIRQWCLTFGLEYARRLRRRRGRMGDTWYLDEVFVKIQGRQQYLWRAVDEDGDVIDILVQSRRDRRAAARFFRKLLKSQGAVPSSGDHRQARQLQSRAPYGHAVGGAQHSAVPRTIVLKSRTSRPDSENARCDASSRPATCNRFASVQGAYRTPSEWADICSARCTIGY